MASWTPDSTTEEQVRCPTCGAGQPWSDTCRRCKCDLSLLRRVAEASERCRRRALVFLRAGRRADALREAHRAHALRPDARSVRLLSVCHLLAGNWLKAIALTQRG
jgi:methionyl-tRNA synthetase